MTRNGNFIVLVVTSILLVGLELYSLTTDSHYKWDFLFLMGLLYGVYYIRERIDLQVLHFGLFAAFLIFHNLGTFDLYATYPLGMEYDHWVHGFFGFVAAMMVAQFYNRMGLYRGAFKVLAIVTVLLGFSALHELYEYIGALVLGEGEGVLFVGAGDLDEWDTQNDMLNNLIGGALGLIVFQVLSLMRGPALARS